VAAETLMIIIIGGPGKQKEERKESQPLEKLEWAEGHRTGQKAEATMESHNYLRVARFLFQFGTTRASLLDPMIQPNCRARFTGDDFDFVVRTLAKNPENKIGLVELLTDIETRDQILDHDALVRAVLEGPGNLTISPQFYFYILARLVLKRSGIDDRALTDYVAALLEKFSQMRQLCSPVRNLETFYLSDLLLALKNASSYQTFLIRAHIGNYALFISGIFYESVESRSQRGAPNFSFYEDMGRASFHALATHDVARRYELSAIFEKLADRFHQCRLALNCLTDEFVNIGDNRFIPSFE
jgi:hypothetical protein